MTNFVQSMAQLGCDQSAHFRFPTRGIAFCMGLAAALERLAPCTYVAVRNIAPMPAAHAAIKAYLSGYYHGASLQGAMCIMATWFKPGIGAGNDELN